MNLAITLLSLSQILLAFGGWCLYSDLKRQIGNMFLLLVELSEE